MAIATLEVTTQSTTGYVTAKDGTTLGYRQLGSGPGLVILHGAMESAESHVQLAEALADAYTVYLIDRRGRGLSGPFSKDYTADSNVDDLSAILDKTGARYVFGLSAGADIVLRAALSLPTIQKIALYEPALFLDPAAPTAALKRFDQEMAAGKVSAAMVTGMLGAQMGPAAMRALPRWLLERFTTMGMASEDKKAAPGDNTMSKMAPTLHYDFQLVAAMSGSLERYKTLRPDVLLMGGTESPAYLKQALDALEKLLPHAKRVLVPGVGHNGSGNSNRGGKPELVAQELRKFFA